MSPTDMLIVTALHAAPTGLDLRQLVEITGRSLRQLQKRSRIMLAEGMIASVPSNGGPHPVVYCTTGAVSAAMQQRRQAHAERVAEQSAKSKVRKAAAARLKRAEETRKRQEKRAEALIRAERELDEALSAPMVHRIVPAHLAEPLKPRGPASVWGLAA